MSDLPCNIPCDNRACHWRSCMGVCRDNEPCDERVVDADAADEELADRLGEAEDGE